MEEATPAGTGTPKGQAGEGTSPPVGKTGAAPQAGEGKPGTAASGKTAAPAGGAGTQDGEPTFFDPKSLAPELLPAYKEMQRAFSKKMEALSRDKTKIEAYDAFSRDPLGQIQQMAARMGYRLTRAEAAAVAEGAGGSPAAGGDWEPKTWQEVIEKISAAAGERLLQQLGPIVSEVQNLRKSNIEKLLDDNCPDWRTYEDEMKANIAAHPSLVNDPVKLYRLSVPPEVLESRATQAALKKLETKVKGAQSFGASSTTRHQDQSLGDKPLTFNEAVKAAKARLAEQGLHPPGKEV